jgi:hypothetical protein
VSWKALAGRLALQFHWPPNVILDLTYDEMVFWLEAARDADK